MSRNSFLTDFLQQYPFWMMDVSPIDRIGLPLFTPIFGFSSITAPEMTLETVDFAEGNSLYRRKAIKRATVAPITLTRGVAFEDSDFYRWTIAALKGDPAAFGLDFGGVTGVSLGSIPGPSVRRNMLLMHMFGSQPFNSDAANDILAVGATTALSLGAFGSSNEATNQFSAATGFVQTGATAALGVTTNIAPPDKAARVPAKAWLLYGCLPTRYKAASDFDASSSAVSIQELDFEYERFEEIGLAA